MPEHWRWVESVEFRERPLPDKLRWLAAKLDKDGTDPVIRFAVASALIAMAARIDGSEVGP